MPSLEARLRNTTEDVNGSIIMATGGYMSQTITATHADWRALAHQAHALFAGDANPRDRATSIPQITVAPSQGEFHVVGRFNNGFNITAECCLRIAGLAAAVMLCNAGVSGALDISVEHKDQVNPVLGSEAASPMCPALVLRVVGAGTTPIHMRTQIASDEDGYAALGSFTSALEQSSLDDQHAARTRRERHDERIEFFRHPVPFLDREHARREHSTWNIHQTASTTTDRRYCIDVAPVEL